MSDNDLVPDSPESLAVDPSVWDSFKSWLDPQGQRNDLAGKGVGPLFDAGLRRALFNAMSFIDDPKTLDPVNAAMSFAGVTPAIGGVIKGFHGTPYKFEPVEHNPFGEFRDSAIGSGEGAQAYGYGHYVAGKKGVADFYKNVLSDPSSLDSILYKDTPVGSLNGIDFAKLEELGLPQEANIAFGALKAFDGDTSKALSYLKDSAYDKSTKLSKEYGVAHDWLESNQQHISKPDKGSLYDLEINADPEQLLDWDAPLHAQSEGVKNILQDKFPGLVDFNKERDLGEFAGQKVAGTAQTGAGLYYKLLAGKPYETAASVQRDASAALAKAGIPGIKYLDQGSRAKAPVEYKIYSAPNLTYRGEAGRIHHDSFATQEAAEEQLQSYQKDTTRDYSIEKTENPQTHNYVIFNPKHLKITARNGVPLERVEHDPFKEKP